MVVYKRCVLVVSGHSYAGKTTIARLLAGRSNLRHIELDDVKAELFADVPDPGNGRGSRRPENTLRTCCAYVELVRRAVEKFEQGVPMVLSGTFSWQIFKAPLLREVTRGGVPSTTVRVYELQPITLSEATRRIKNRNPNISELDLQNRVKGYRFSSQQQLKSVWPVDLYHKKIEVERPLEEIVKEIQKDLLNFQQAV